MSQSYLAEMEEMQQLVAESLYEDERAVYDVLAPDGVPFGMQDNVLDDNAKLQQYLVGFKGNPLAQQAWITERVQQSMNELNAAGVPLEEAAQNDTRVWEVAMEAAIYYSYKCELLLAAHRRRNGNG